LSSAFCCQVELDRDQLVRVVVRIARIGSRPWCLALDRTRRRFERRDVDILMPPRAVTSHGHDVFTISSLSPQFRRLCPSFWPSVPMFGDCVARGLMPMCFAAVGRA
jgi:hypothetical protein